MLPGKVMRIAILCATAFVSAPCVAQEPGRHLATVSDLRTFAIVGADDARSGGAFDQIAELSTAELERKGYRLAAPGYTPDMVVKLSHRVRSLRSGASSASFMPEPSAVNSVSPSEPYPYPSGAIGGRTGRGRFAWSAPAVESSLAVEISSADEGLSLFADGVRKRQLPRSVKLAWKSLVEAAFERLPSAGS